MQCVSSCSRAIGWDVSSTGNWWGWMYKRSILLKKELCALGTVFIWIFLTSFMSLAGLMNECWKHLRLECANLTKSWCDLLLKGNAEESVSNSILTQPNPTQPNQPSQPNQLCMRVSLKHSWVGLFFFLIPSSSGIFQNFQNQGTPHFQVFKKN
jgi:hypothetical protein